MENNTESVYFVLAAYGDVGHFKYLYFSVMLLWFASIWVANSVLILIIVLDKRLHEPMYMLLCNLFVNEISGSTSLYPLLLTQMLSDSHRVALPFCFLQMSYIYASASVEFCSLAAMAYDRYVAICHPLQYSLMMSTGRVWKILSAVWGYSLVNVLLLFSSVVHLDFCGNIINKAFCDYSRIIQLACSASAFNKMSDLLFAFLTMFLPFSLILFSYSKILLVCLRASKENARKAVSTVTPQIISVLNLFIGCTFHFVDARMGATLKPVLLRLLFSVYLLVVQPIVTPFMYGFSFPRIRQSWKRFLLSHKAVFRSCSRS